MLTNQDTLSLPFSTSNPTPVLVNVFRNPWRRFHTCLVLLFLFQAHLISHGLAEHSVFLSRGHPWTTWDSMLILTYHTYKVQSITALACQLELLTVQGLGFGSAIHCEVWHLGAALFWAYDVIDFQCGLQASHLTSLAQLTIWKMSMIISHKGIVRLLTVHKVLGKWKAVDAPHSVINHVASWIQAARMLRELCFLDNCTVIPHKSWSLNPWEFGWWISHRRGGLRIF